VEEAIDMSTKTKKQSARGLSISKKVYKDSRLHDAGKKKRLILPDPQIVFAFDISNRENGQIEQ
jgi:hypothetical protein